MMLIMSNNNTRRAQDLAYTCCGTVCTICAVHLDSRPERLRLLRQGEHCWYYHGWIAASGGLVPETLEGMRPAKRSALGLEPI